MAASDYVPIFFKNRLHLAGRPQMSTRPNKKLSRGVVGIVGQMGMLMSENLPREDRRKAAAMLRDLADEIENWE
jgi:hypothetical protein